MRNAELAHPVFLVQLELVCVEAKGANEPQLTLSVCRLYTSGALTLAD